MDTDLSIDSSGEDMVRGESWAQATGTVEVEVCTLMGWIGKGERSLG